MIFLEGNYLFRKCFVFKHLYINLDLQYVMSSPLLIQTLGKKCGKLWSESEKIKYNSRIRVTIELYIFMAIIKLQVDYMKEFICMFFSMASFENHMTYANFILI